MLPTHQHVKTHNAYAIYQRRPGFEFTPIMLGKIASFIIQGDDGRIAVFAFMYSMLLALEGEPIQEDALLAHAVETIQGRIDAARVGNRQELTFEYAGETFVEVTDARWWIPSFA